MTPEGIVVEEVQRYFSQPKFQIFYTDTEYPIQWGLTTAEPTLCLLIIKGISLSLQSANVQG